MKPTLYALKCQKCGSLLTEISSNENCCTYVCANGCKVFYSNRYINRFQKVKPSDQHTSKQTAKVPRHCPSCNQPAGASFAPVGFQEIECGTCRTKLVYNNATGKWEVVESVGA